MNRYPVYYPFSPWYADSKAELVKAARDYFGQQSCYVQEGGRVPHNLDIHTWVYMFIRRHVRSGEIPKLALVEDIARLTELLWDIAVMEMMDSEGERESLAQ